MEKCEKCGKSDGTVRVRLIPCGDVCRCQDDETLCARCYRADVESRPEDYA